MKKDKMNGNFKHFYNLSDKKISEFAEANKAAFDDFEFSDDWDCYQTVVRLNGFEIHFLIGEGLSRGYRFLEGSEAKSEPCLLTRFKFDFSDFYFSPYDIHNVLELSDFRTLDFHRLLDDSMINDAFSSIFNFITQNRVSIERISSDLTLRNKLVENFSFDMGIVSKKITDDKLRSDFFKYFTKHEFNMYFCIEGADIMLGFVSTGKRKPLENYFLKKGCKNKLITYEKRFYEYLMDHDFSMMQGSQHNFVNKIKTDDKHSAIIQTVSVIIALLFAFSYDLVTHKIAEVTVFKDCSIIYTYNVLTFIWIIGVVAFTGLISLAVKKLFFKNSTVKSVLETNNKAVNTVLIALCVVLAAVYFPIQYFSNQNCIALGDNEIIINQSLRERETVSYDSGRVEFFLSDGWYDEDENTHYDEKELIIVIDGDYDNYIVSDVYDEELEQTLGELKAHNVTVTEFTDIDEFWDMYNIQY